MINKLKLRNFQSHKNTELGFCDGINVIIGKSDSGKSAIIRALKWIIKNRPLGDGFISDWADSSEVELKIDESTLKRIKSKKENKYILNDEELKAVNKGIPEQVNDFLSISDVNIQHQMDSHFLLSDEISGKNISEFLNKIVNLESIDKTLYNIDKRKREYEKLQSYNIELLKKHEEEIKEFNDIDIIENLITKVEKEENYFKKLKKDYSEIIYAIKNIKEIEEEIKNLPDSLNEIESKIRECDNLVNGVESKIRECENLKNIITNIKNSNNKINQASAELENLEKEFEELMPDVCPLCGK